MGEAGRGRCSGWCYGLICVCLSPIFSILSFFDWLEQWMDVGLEGRREGGLILSCEAKIGAADNGSKTEPIVKCDSLKHDWDAFREVNRKRLEQFAHGRKFAAFPQSASHSDRQKGLLQNLPSHLQSNRL